MKTNTSTRRRIVRSLLATAFPLLACSGFGANPIYPAVVAKDGPLAYYRFNDSLERTTVNKNSGSLGAAGNATNTYNVHPFPGALAGSGNRSQFYDSTAWAMIPHNAALNPGNTQPFTVEAWFYPASDQINGGQCTLNNRLAGGAPDRTGWVFFQRAPDDSYAGKAGYEGVGWNCRMYRGSGSSSGVDVTSQVPYEVGKWAHVVVVYDPVEVTNATLTMYINGVAANTNVWTGGDDGLTPGYAGNAAGSDVALSLGAYNNTSGAGGNPYFGAIDEFAFYAAKLTPAQILAHYQNATNANRTMPYETLIASDNPVAYLRLDEIAPGPDIAINMGDLRATGLATNTTTVRHPARSALAGRTDDGSFAGHWRGGGGTYANMPWIAANNPDAGVPFTFEAWFRPLNDQMQPGPCPVANRYKTSGNRTGWIIYQRDPNDSYLGPPAVPGSEGVGWNFRTYNGNGSSGGNVVTGVPYTMGEWQHFVVTWEPQFDNGPSTGGSEQWQGILTAYFNGYPVVTNETATYAANVELTEDGLPPSDLAIGSYNQASAGGEEFEGDIDEVAFYNNYVLTPDQILTHYQTGTNAHPAVNYETLVLMAAYDGSAQRMMPKTYLRFNDPAVYPASNSGSLGPAADGGLVLTANNATGPIPPLAGFESSNSAVPLDGSRGWIGLNDPSGLNNISGKITLEAWIKPGAAQGNLARIISHGPPTPTVHDLATYPLTLSGSLLTSNEVFLRIEGGETNYYVVGSSDGTDFHGATYAVPADDLGSTNWIQLVGTYDGSKWHLYRNALEVASSTDSVGALPVPGAEWAVGATGNGWADYFSGNIDEVAIYNVALTMPQVQAHYAAADSGIARLRLTVTQLGGTYYINWPYPEATLEAADAVTGEYKDVGGATSPYPVPSGTTKKFYRCRL